jgi:hypothetical protein
MMVKKGVLQILRSHLHHFFSIDFAGVTEEDHYLLMKKQKKNVNSTNTPEVICKMNKIIEAEKSRIKPVKSNADDFERFLNIFLV